MLQDNVAAIALEAQNVASASSSSALPVAKGMPPTDSAQWNLPNAIQEVSVQDLKDVFSGQNSVVNDAMSSLVELVVGFVPKLLCAILVLWIGFKLIKIIKKALLRTLKQRNAEPSLWGFLSSFVDVTLKVLLIIMAMDIIGIKATSFIAIIGAMGLAIGMALQGTLQNLAGGVIILLMKPFRVGNYIECGSYKGYVKEIRIFHTIIRSFQGRIIVIPNSQLATNSLINHTQEPNIRLDVVVGVAYGSDIPFVRSVIQELLDSDTRILKDPPAKISVSNLNESSVDLTIWLWATPDDYWAIWMNIREDIYNAFNKNGISIPFPQMTIHTENGPSKTPDNKVD